MWCRSFTPPHHPIMHVLPVGTFRCGRTSCRCCCFCCCCSSFCCSCRCWLGMQHTPTTRGSCWGIPQRRAAAPFAPNPALESSLPRRLPALLPLIELQAVLLPTLLLLQQQLPPPPPPPHMHAHRWWALLLAGTARGTAGPPHLAPAWRALPTGCTLEEASRRATCTHPRARAADSRWSPSACTCARGVGGWRVELAASAPPCMHAQGKHTPGGQGGGQPRIDQKGWH